MAPDRRAAGDVSRLPPPALALLRPSESDDVSPGTPGLSDAQLGSVAEDRLATAIQLSAAGTVAMAFPLLDLGFDLYPRRIRTLRAHPVQVKARSFLEPDGEFEAASAAFSEKELVDLTIAIGLMNAYNRLAIAFRNPPKAAI